MYLAYHYIEYYCFFHFSKPDKKPLLNEDGEEEEEDKIQLPGDDDSVSSSSSYQKKHKLKVFDWSLISISLVLLLSLLLILFLIIPRTPHWQLDSVTFQKFEVNSDMTSSLTFTTDLHLKNLGFGQITLQNVQLGILFNSIPCGSTNATSVKVGSQASQTIQSQSTIRRIGPTVGAAIQRTMQKNDGIVTFELLGKGQIRSTGNVLRKIQFSCFLTVNLNSLPNTVSGTNCIESVDVTD